MMEDNLFSVQELNMNFTPTLFLDDMLNYVSQRLSISRTPVLLQEQRNEYLSDASYTFPSEVGDALIHIIRTCNKIAENMIAFSNFLLIEETEVDAMEARIIQLLKFHKATSLSDLDFYLDPKVWCSQLLHYLLIVASLCLHFERGRNVVISLNIMNEACSLLDRLMDDRDSEKIEHLKMYARSTLTDPPLTHTRIYILP